MRILVVSQYFWPENFRINDLVDSLKERGHEITVFTGKPNYQSESFYEGYTMFGKSTDDYHGVPVLRVPLIARGKSTPVRLVINYLSFVFFSLILAPIKCRNKYDIIFVYEPSPITVALPAILLNKLKKIPLVLWVQDLWPESVSATGAIKAKIPLKLVNSLVRYIYNQCDLILIQSEAFRPSVQRYISDGKKIKYYPNTAEDIYRTDASCFHDEDIHFPIGFKILFAGNIGAAQDFKTILDSAVLLKEFSDIHWVIVGDGRMKDWVEKEVETRGLSKCFHLMGKHPLGMMPFFFSNSEVMLVTLKREQIFSFTIPGKIQSYLASGKPLVGCLDGEGKRIIHEANAGRIAPAQDPERLAENVLSIYRMTDEERKKMGENGIKYYEDNFKKEKLLNNLESWFQDLVN